MIRCGRRTWRSTAVAAAASGGATMAPSATAAAQGRAGSSHRATAATAPTVRPTAPSTRPPTGAQLSRRSRGLASKAASSSTGATKRASARSGSNVASGAPGTKASTAPASASSAGHGTPKCGASRARPTPASRRPRTNSNTAIATDVPRAPWLSNSWVRGVGRHPILKSRAKLGWLSPAADEIGKFGHVWMPDDAEPVSEVIPERDTKLGAGMHQTKERVAAITTGIAAGPAADLALGDLAADVALRTVGVQRNLRPVEHHQQLGFVGMQPLEQAIKGGKSGAPVEDAVEPVAHLAAAPGRGRGAIRLEIGVEPPDQLAHALLGGAVQVGEGVELVHQPFGVHPA